MEGIGYRRWLSCVQDYRGSLQISVPKREAVDRGW